MSDKALAMAFEDIGKRFRSIIPTWFIGVGAEYGRLLPYAKHICFTLLLKVFFQELQDDTRRSREDLIQSVLGITEKFKLECTYAEAERIVESMMWSGSKKFTFAFEEPIFNEKEGNWEIFRFHFFEIDRELSELEVGSQYFKLSQESEELILKSHEIVEELDIDLQQFIAELLIKKGNLKSALRILDALDVKVRKLILSEKEHKEEIIRNPKRVFYREKHKWGTQLEEVKKQFKEEIDRYSQMNRLLRKIKVLDKERAVYNQLVKRISKTGTLHDSLANIVIANIRLEIEIKGREMEHMWLASRSSFRETVWEQAVNQTGFAHPDDMFDLIESMFSPIKHTMLPLEWAIEEHSSPQTNFTFDESERKKLELVREPITLNWKVILSLWEPVFIELLEKGVVSIDSIKKSDEVVLTKWLEHKDAFDFWIAFSSLEKPFGINEESLNKSNDNKAVLIQELIKKNPSLKALFGKQILSRTMIEESLTIQNKVSVSNYHLFLKEIDENERV